MVAYLPHLVRDCYSVEHVSTIPPRKDSYILALLLRMLNLFYQIS